MHTQWQGRGWSDLAGIQSSSGMCSRSYTQTTMHQHTCYLSFSEGYLLPHHMTESVFRFTRFSISFLSVLRLPNLLFDYFPPFHFLLLYSPSCYCTPPPLPLLPLLLSFQSFISSSFPASLPSSTSFCSTFTFSHLADAIVQSDLQ